MNLFIDVRDIREILKSEGILGVKHVRRGVLEFRIDNYSPYYKEIFNKSINFIFYYASDWIFALGNLRVNNVDHLNVFHLTRGCNKWIELEDPFKENR